MTVTRHRENDFPFENYPNALGDSDENLAKQKNSEEQYNGSARAPYLLSSENQ